MLKYSFNPHKIIKKIQVNNQLKDYTYFTLFFLISSFFIFFVIKPSMLMAFSLRERLNRLSKIDKEYEKSIINIIDIQNQLINAREHLNILELSLPSKPETKKIVDFLDKVASEEASIVKNLSISSLDLINKKENLNSFNFYLELESNFSSIQRIIEKILNNRRLIDIKKLTISKIRFNQDSTQEAKLRLELILESYYL